MNAMEKVLFEFQVEMARNPGGLNDGKLASLLTEFTKESDDNLRAAAELFGLDVEDLEERAAILELDTGFSRITANRLALTQALHHLMPDLTEKACRWFSGNSAFLVRYGREHGLSRVVLFENLRVVSQRRNNARKTVRPALLLGA